MEPALPGRELELVEDLDRAVRPGQAPRGGSRRSRVVGWAEPCWERWVDCFPEAMALAWVEDAVRREDEDREEAGDEHCNESGGYREGILY